MSKISIFTKLPLAILFTVTMISSVNAANVTNAVAEDDWADDSWGDDEWQEQASSAWQFSGFAELGQGNFLQDNIVDSSSSLSELRARAEISYSAKTFEFNASGDLLHDQVISDTQWQTRELTLSASPFSMLDVKIGRQVLTWGTGDYLFLNDLFAKDWQSFFSGRDDEYLKAPSNSVRLTAYASDFSFDFAWTPTFTPDNYLTGERFAFYSPISGENIAPGDDFLVEQTRGDQFSLRIATTKQGVEYAVYGYKGYWTTPVGFKASDTSAANTFNANIIKGNVVPTDNQHISAYFPEMNSFGASMRMPLGKGLFNSEFAYYNSVEDSQGDKANIANSQLRILVGYEQELAKDFTASMQYYLEQTLDYQAYQQSYPQSNPLYNSAEDELVDEFRQVLTMRLRYATMQQKLTYNLFAFYSPTDHDSYLKPSLNYRYSDQVSFSAGANLFFGEQAHTFFAQHKDNSNAWLRLRVHY